MARFRKRPIEIEAELFDAAEDGMNALMEFLAPCEGWCVAEKGIEIPTLEGTMLARPGDWIIRGVNGEFYPCKPDIFAATYEPVDPSNVRRQNEGGLLDHA